MSIVVRRRYLPREIVDMILDYAIGRIDAHDERYEMIRKRPVAYPIVSIHHPGSFFFVHLYRFRYMLIHVKEDRINYYYDDDFVHETKITFVLM